MIILGQQDHIQRQCRVYLFNTKIINFQILQNLFFILNQKQKEEKYQKMLQILRNQIHPYNKYSIEAQFSFHYFQISTPDNSMETTKNNLKSHNQGQEIRMIGQTNIQNMKTANQCRMDPNESRIINEKQRSNQIETPNIFDNRAKQKTSIGIHSNVLSLQIKNQRCEEQLFWPYEEETHSIQLNSSEQSRASICERKLNTCLNKQRQSGLNQHLLQAQFGQQQQKESQKMIHTTKLYQLGVLNDETHLSDSQQSKDETRQFQVGIQRNVSEQKDPTDKKEHLNKVNKKQQEVKQVLIEQQQSSDQQQIPRLTQQQKQQKFEKRLQQERLQKFQLKLQQQRIKANKYLQRMIKDPRIQRAIKALPAKFKKIPKIPDLLLLEINVDLINQIQLCQTYDCFFLAFLIPYMYLLGSTLNFYEYESSKNLSFYFVFTQLINKIKKIKNKNNAQLSEQELLDHLTIFANYRKYTPFELNSMIGDFIKKHSLRMRGFMPAYYDIFYFHAFQKYPFVDSLQRVGQIRLKRQKITQRLDDLWAEIRKRYHNQNI